MYSTLNEEKYVISSKQEINSLLYSAASQSVSVLSFTDLKKQRALLEPRGRFKTFAWILFPLVSCKLASCGV